MFAAHSVDSDIFYVVINLSAGFQVLHYNLLFLKVYMTDFFLYLLYQISLMS